MIKNKVYSFVILCYSITTIYSLFFIIFPYRVNNMISLLIFSFYMFIPLISAFILQKFVYKEDFKSIGINFSWSWWYLFSLFVPFLWNFFAFIFAVLLPDVTFSPDMSGMFEKYSKYLTEDQVKLMKAQIEKVPAFLFFLGTLIQTVILGCTINVIFAFGEEFGWRGFLYNNLKEKGFYYNSFITGTVWGIWHFPVIIQGHNYPEHRIQGVFVMILWAILLSPFFTFIVYKTGSVLSAAIMHGILNASYGFSIMYIKGGNDLTVGVTGLSGIFSLIVCNLILFFYIKFFEKDIFIKKITIIDNNNKI